MLICCSWCCLHRCQWDLMCVLMRIGQLHACNVGSKMRDLISILWAKLIAPMCGVLHLESEMGWLKSNPYCMVAISLQAGDISKNSLVFCEHVWIEPAIEPVNRMLRLSITVFKDGACDQIRSMKVWHARLVVHVFTPACRGAFEEPSQTAHILDENTHCLDQL